MYLIILLVVVGKLAFVSGECDIGTPKLENVDLNEVSTDTQQLYNFNRHTNILLDIINNFITTSIGSN
jgi:hypothetical protein